MNATDAQTRNFAEKDLRVLIVEDSELDAGLMVRELERSGCRVAWRRVETAADLTAALDRETWEVVLADFTLPRLSGLEALELVQARNPDLPFLLVSGTIGEETAVAAMRAGVSDYVLKDRMARLGLAVQHALREAGERRARRQAEDLLRRLYHAVEQSPAVIVITDLEGRIEYANPRCSALTGYALEELRGRPSRILKSGRTTQAEYARLWKTISSGGQWRGEFANRTKDGRLYWEDAAISPVRDGSGRMTHYVKVAEDITERKQVEESLRKLQAKLRQAQKMEALSELAGGIARDFNNYLSAIIVNAQIARTGSPAGAAAGEYLDRVVAAGRQAAGLARQMLTFSRRGELQRQPLQLGPVVQEALRVLQATLPANVEAEINIPAGGRVVLADATQVQEVVINLWTNACHACREAGGRIVVSLTDVDVGPADADLYPGVPLGPYVRLTVRDNGCGMSPELQERIFEPFFSTKPEGQGTGLGLSVVQSIMLAHQGAVCVESRPQQGTTFQIFFPQDLQHSAAAAPVEAPPRGRGERILLVDDHALCRDAMHNLLESLGYGVTAFGAPQEALAAFRAHPEGFDLVLTDMSMREMSGAELARCLHDVRPTIPIILGSGYQLAGAAEQLRDLGIREVLAKPIQRDGLAAAVARALSPTRGSGHIL